MRNRTKVRSINGRTGQGLDCDKFEGLAARNRRKKYEEPAAQAENTWAYWKRKLYFGMTRMLRKIEGTVQTYRAIDVRSVQFEIQGANNVIDLNLEQPWVLRNGDYVVVAGEDDGRSGKFKGYAYRNDTRHIFGKSDPGLLDGYRYILMGLFFFWAIFPVFIHIPAGLRRLELGRRIDQAASMLCSKNE